jgi:hypothetical protein
MFDAILLSMLASILNAVRTRAFWARRRFAGSFSQSPTSPFDADVAVVLPQRHRPRRDRFTLAGRSQAARDDHRATQHVHRRAIAEPPPWDRGSTTVQWPTCLRPSSLRSCCTRTQLALRRHRPCSSWPPVTRRNACTESSILNTMPVLRAWMTMVRICLAAVFALLMRLPMF